MRRVPLRRRHQDDPQVHDVGAGRAGDQQVAEGGEEGIGIVVFGGVGRAIGAVGPGESPGQAPISCSKTDNYIYFFLECFSVLWGK